MQTLDEIAERIHQSFNARTARRDEILGEARTLTRHCANAIRAIHRDERELANQHLAEARLLVDSLRGSAGEYADLYFAGYTQDALKEFAEANLVAAFVRHEPLPAPEELSVEYATYLQGLAEAAGELRRRSLDMLLKENPDEANRLLAIMDDIYGVLVTMDYPDAITGGLRRLTDLARSIIERTRGDLTLSLRQEHLEKALKELEERLSQG
jgi:translin